MSCVLVGYGTLKINPDEITPLQLSYLVVRDIIFTTWYTILLYVAFTHPDTECIQGTGVVTWLFFAGIVTVLRLIKNPLQFIANRQLTNNGANWENPVDVSNSWHKYFSPTCTLCSMRIYALVDWMSYFAWIVSLTSFRPSQLCNDNLVTVAGYYEIGISTLVYILSLVSYTLAYALHRASKGRCLPGFMITRSADGCPGIAFDRTLWRQVGEDVQEYRRRVVEHFEVMNYIMNQPISMRQMDINEGVCRLTMEELSSLKTLRYSTRLQRSASIATIKSLKLPIQRARSTSDETIQEPGQGETFTQVEIQPQEPERRDEERTTDDTCALCIEDYREGDLLRELHCGHRYHAECVDEWLTTSKRTCPVCNSDAVGRCVSQEPIQQDTVPQQ